MNHEILTLPVNQRIAAFIDDKWSHLGWGHRRMAAEAMGFDPGHMSRLLKGKHAPDQESLQKFSEGLDVPVGVLEGKVIPVLGVISAGEGIGEEVFDVRDTLPITEYFEVGSVAYRVRGDSMEDAHIMNGDHIIVRKKPSPEVGEVVVVYIPDKGTMVKLKQEKNYASANEANKRAPIIRTPGCVEYGVYIGAVRKYPLDQPKNKKIRIHKGK